MSCVLRRDERKKMICVGNGFCRGARVISPANGGEFCCRHISISLKFRITLRTLFPCKHIIYVCCSRVAGKGMFACFFLFFSRLLSWLSQNVACCSLVDDFPECNVLNHQKSDHWFSFICFFFQSVALFHLYVSLFFPPRLSFGLWCSGYGIT